MSLDPEVRRGGNLPFGMVAACWMCDPRYTTNARTLYAILVTYADTQARDTEKGKPYRKELAAQMGVSVSTVDRTLVEMEVAGMVTIEERPDPDNPANNESNVYHLHDAPLMWQGNGEWNDPLPSRVKASDVAKHLIEQRRAEKREAGVERRGGVPKGVNAKAVKAAREAAPEHPAAGDSGEGGGSTGAARGSSTDAARVAARTLPNIQSPHETPRPEPSSFPDAGGSTSGSSDPEGGSGFAAAGKNALSSDDEDRQAGFPGQRASASTELSREQLAAVRAVEAVLPPALHALLPYGQFPKRNRAAVLNALESRTVEQLRERAGRRWLAYGYEPALNDEKLTNPIGAALELIAPPRYCPDLSCEDGAMIDTGAECRGCLERRTSRRAARAAGQLVKNGSSAGAGSGRMPECTICQAPFPGVVPDSGECRTCEEEAAAVFAVLSARLDLPADTGQDSPLAAVGGAAQEAPAVDQETARLRAHYARQFGTPEQVEAYCTDAPF